ncbi:hypothetical protein [Nitrosarchaeum sp. AC2]|uniref:hypothetical protein n=1 Tax=Nitrosarchaeum sp. AC2 TaxID=2259673 RepID=UPI0015C7205E|nr:hypothetical protein [Nitrosarchaeum sp. AC2]QLH11239.1 hypothetical protein DSQ20_07040 [Nitrosarchaeum sp. AC2]
MTSNYYDLALRWAPIDYQYIRLNKNPQSYETKKDLLCAVNLDCYPNSTSEECWNTENIRERLRKTLIENLTPVCYYAVSETDSHYFILYSFYHADDDTHPNDMEGCMIILEKIENGELLLGMITIAHLDFWKYSYDNNLLKSSGEQFSPDEYLETDDDVDGEHPLIQQEEGKHGLYALGTHINIGTKIVRWFLAVLNKSPDVIVYYPGKKATMYSAKRLKKGKKTPYDPSFYYELVDIFDSEQGLWERWKKRPNNTFDKDGKLHGGSANPPWLWKPGLSHSSDDALGMLWTNPASLVKDLFRPGIGRKEFSQRYITTWPSV